MAQILLLEPDAKLGSLYKEILSKDFDVEHCRMSFDAISILDKKTIDIVVLELQIALHNGIEFLYEMRSYSEWQNIPVILHTNVSPQWYENCGTLKDQLNITAYLYKPVTKLHMLRTAVRDQFLVSNV